MICIDEATTIQFLMAQAQADSAHDLNHIRRVVASAKQLAQSESARLDVVVPAAWLHDCVIVPKNSPDRSKASRFAADAAVEFLKSQGCQSSLLEAIHHAIATHSFSAQIPCETIEAKVVQDADRLDALGAIGIARCFLTGGAMNLSLYEDDDPFCERRVANDREYVVDHFYQKLFTLPETMQTSAGQQEATRRCGIMRDYLEQLKQEIGLF